MLEYQTVLPPYENSFIEELPLVGLEVFGDLDQKELVWRLREMPNSSVQVARHGQLVGFKIGYAVASQRYYSWLGGVRHDGRRKGIALRLMERQHSWVQTQGYASVETETASANTTMLMLDIRAGFRVVGSYVRRDYLRVVLVKDRAQAEP